MRSPTGGLVRTSYIALVLMLLGAAALLMWAVYYPPFYRHWCVEYYIPSAQEAFGFRAGRLPLQGSGYERLAVVDVTPGGSLSRGGFRPGDIPVGLNGGEIDFCNALRAAEDGQAKVDVSNVAESRLEGRRVRTLEISRVERGK